VIGRPGGLDCSMVAMGNVIETYMSKLSYYSRSKFGMQSVQFYHR
jgi:hypothetical protein